MTGFMYILQCIDGSYYVGSTKDLESRLELHRKGRGANHTRKRLPVELIYYEEYHRIDDAFSREKQVQGWSRIKKEALIDGRPELLPKLAMAYRDLRAEKVAARLQKAQCDGNVASTSATEGGTTVASSTSATEREEDSDSPTVPEVLEGTTQLEKPLRQVPEALEGTKEDATL